MNYKIFKVPYEEGAYWRKGAGRGPDAIYEHLQRAHPQSVSGDANLGIRFSSFPVQLVSHSPYSKSGYLATIEQAITDSLDKQFFPVILGGDHAITLPIIRAFSAKYGVKQFGIIHIDAHSDTFPPVDGYKYHHGAVFRNIVEEGLVAPKNIHQIGVRGLCGDGWMSFVEEQGINLVHMDKFRALGCSLHSLKLRKDIPYYVSIDIDSVDPAFAPGTGTPVPGGFSSAEILLLARQISTLDVIGFDLVEVAPVYDHADITSLLAAHIVAELMINISAYKKVST
ncbi:agmatinase [Acinetobacter sp. ANC 4169]|jgi:agmatinase|uniref:agmatinase n=1 Tax=Acinetobacter sp. ANC 4169 TaxID=1977879 RepID=UPI000A343B21|nr:agmatinase [Acinetobacter sp. ANC 4169]OTG77225.1 agmatinase [Acinetobacter sp. ANC 4169]